VAELNNKEGRPNPPSHLTKKIMISKAKTSDLGKMGEFQGQKPDKKKNVGNCDVFVLGGK